MADHRFEIKHFYQEYGYVFVVVKRTADSVVVRNVATNKTTRRKISTTYIRGESYEKLDNLKTYYGKKMYLLATGILSEYVNDAIAEAKRSYEYYLSCTTKAQPEASAPATETTQANSEQPASKQETQQKISRFEVGKTYTGNFSGSYDFDGYSKSYTVIKRTAKTVTLKETWPATSWWINSEQRKNSKPFVKKPHVSGDCEVIQIDCCIWIEANNPDTNFSSEQPETATIEEVKPADVDVPAIVEEAAPVLDEQAVVNAYNATVLKMGEMLDAGKNDMPTLWEFHKSLGIEETVINEVFKRLQDKGFFQGMAGTGGSPTFCTPCREEFFEEVKRITALTAQHEEAHIEPTQEPPAPVQEIKPATSEQPEHHERKLPTPKSRKHVYDFSKCKDAKTLCSLFKGESLEVVKYIAESYREFQPRTDGKKMTKKDYVTAIVKLYFPDYQPAPAKKSTAPTKEELTQIREALLAGNGGISVFKGMTLKNAENKLYHDNCGRGYYSRQELSLITKALGIKLLNTTSNMIDVLLGWMEDQGIIKSDADAPTAQPDNATVDDTPIPVQEVVNMPVVVAPNMNNEETSPIQEVKPATDEPPAPVHEDTRAAQSCTPIIRFELGKTYSNNDSCYPYNIRITSISDKFVESKGKRYAIQTGKDHQGHYCEYFTRQILPFPVETFYATSVIDTPSYVCSKELSSRAILDIPEEKLAMVNLPVKGKISNEEKYNNAEDNRQILKSCTTKEILRRVLNTGNARTLFILAMTFNEFSYISLNGSKPTKAECIDKLTAIIFPETAEDDTPAPIQKSEDMPVVVAPNMNNEETSPIQEVKPATDEPPAPEIKQSAPEPVMKPRKSSRRKTDDTRQLTFCFDEDNEPAAAQSAPAPKQKRTRRTSQHKTDDSRQILILFPEDISDCKTNERIAA